MAKEINRKTPSQLDFPVFLMNFPLTVSNENPNNAWMKENKEYNYDKAFEEFMRLYTYVTNYALIYILPSEREFQDLPYVANIGCYLPHIKDRDVVLVANFKSTPRKGEEWIGKKFFSSMGYEVYRPPFTWEGEADLKWIRDNIYIAGYGMRTDKKTHEWMSRNFDMNITSIEMNDEKLYHFDCSFFPLGETKALVATKAMAKESIKAIEKIVEIIDIPEGYIYSGWTNCILLGNKVLHAPASDDDSIEPFKKFITKAGFEPLVFDLQEYEKSGADLSCLFLHLNYNNRKLISSKANLAWWAERLLKLPKAEKIPPPSHQKLFNGFNIIVENPAGTQRDWTDHATGEKGTTRMQYDYGYFLGSEGMDKDCVDCYIGPDEHAPMAYVIKQLVPGTSKFDEVKVMIGFSNPEAAKMAYLLHYNKKGFYGGMTAWPVDKLRIGLEESKRNPKVIKSRYLFGKRI